MNVSMHFVLLPKWREEESNLLGECVLTSYAPAMTLACANQHPLPVLINEEAVVTRDKGFTL